MIMILTFIGKEVSDFQFIFASIIFFFFTIIEFINFKKTNDEIEMFIEYKYKDLLHKEKYVLKLIDLCRNLKN